MIARLLAWRPSWWNAWRKPHVCPNCNLRCKSKTGLGRHRAAERRAKESAAQQPALPLPPPASEACPVKSSVTGAACLLPTGHEAHDASRFHMYPPPDPGSQVMSGAEIACVNPFHLRNGHHDKATCYTTRSPPPVEK